MMHPFSRWLWQLVREVLSWLVIGVGGYVIYWLLRLPL